MEWLLFMTVFTTVSKAAFSFNVDPVAWKSLSNPAEGFGYQIVQKQSGLLVSAPLAQYSQNSRGQIFKCSISSCSVLAISAPNFAVNMSLGLTMTFDAPSQNTMVCGPTIPKDCGSITMYNGVCLEIDQRNRVGPPVPSSLTECRSQADIAFLLDGSGSVNSVEFVSMKTFVKDLISTFVGKDSRFAIAQYSDNPSIHYFFDNFNVNNWKKDIDAIDQKKGLTYTAQAIRSVVNHIFTQNRGSRANVRRILIVITDGESHDSNDLSSAADAAQKKNIVRFSIGVGNAFNSDTATTELETIASSPPGKFMFKVGSFEALKEIKRTLEDTIFAIEGSQSSGETLKMEMAQQGFSAAYVPGGKQLSAVGANQWRGGFLTYTSGSPSSYLPVDIEPDSYLGYSMAIAKTPYATLTVVGAPRYQHRGVVMVISQNRNDRIDPFQWQYQIGEYFGAAVCAMDVNRDANTDVILISSPMFVEDDREGRVYVCIINNLNVQCSFDSPVVLRGVKSRKGRFGASLAVLPDLNSDGLNDLAVGAPLEDDGQGSIYIFHGERPGNVSPTFSQRIAGSKAMAGLRFFGMSISQSSLDLSGDNLPDLAVGSKGTVVLLRTKPIVMVEAKVTYMPKQIVIQNHACNNPLENTANICIVISRHSSIQTARARVNYTLTLDATRKVPNNRAYIKNKNGYRETTGSVILDLDLAQSKCVKTNFFIEPCPEDALNPLYNELRFTFEGLPDDNMLLRPSLAQQAQTTTLHPLDFEINCGTDNKCVDNLQLDFNFTSSSEVKVGIDELLNITVSVVNLAENSYNTLVVLTYPAGASYRKFTSLQAVFVVSYGIETNSQLNNSLSVTANATSGNEKHSPSSRLYKIQEISVKYSIFITMESSLSYVNFTYGKNELQKSVQQSFLVTNNIRDLNFTVVIRVPVKLADKDLWADLNTLQIADCRTHNDEGANILDFVGQIQKNKIIDCSVATCRVFKCNSFMERFEGKRYTLSANMSSQWIQQIGLSEAKYMLTSTASLEYDRNEYIFYSTSSSSNPPVRKIETVVEVYPLPDFTKEIVGGSLGGLALLALLTAILYKVGFFKSKYQQMMNEANGAETDGLEESTPTQE
ncbi:integrin alpha-X-like isoform X2 [Nerophis ophidion]|uniref:integrin alpha-X-like isoform X2 n=1 Tax=Nerophis ophidion TaxID=159077 RepID=UPI002ADFC7D7|nr:integrin alpha-X-like isoform X2 [Nerophis ophidion]